ncbi:MAG: hypothetical protein A2Y15_08740 [Clostridiales bacterium GWF2_36_10]|nr:MAG: hypothetical protein A2Y15_08740 [Clostridiales bacterium GWF2_36_10]HAN20430.1 hypothetical protein [Clostridiales bacterium]
MAITAGANTLALNSVINTILNGITVISIKNVGGEYFRKIPTDIEEISATSKLYTFYLNETEGNTIITSVSLYGNGATTTLGNGTEIASQALSLTKDNTQSLTISWEVSIV